LPKAPYEQLVRWDAELVQLSRGVGAAILALGHALERLKSKGWHRELGYSALEYYALQRCCRPQRWAPEAAALARRLARLPTLRSALVQGRINLSMATLVSSHATAETDEFVTAKARQSTVREMREFLRGLAARNVQEPDGEGTGAAADPGEPAARVGAPEDRPAGEVVGEAGPTDAFAENSSAECEASELSAEDDPRCTLSVSISASDHLVLQRSLALLRGLMGQADDETLVSALLAEAQVTLAHAVPEVDTQCESEFEKHAAAQRAWEQVRAGMRAESEKRCEQNLRVREASGGGALWSTIPEVEASLREQFEQSLAQIEAARTPQELDRWICARSRALGQRDLEIGRLSAWLDHSEGWNRLGYASPAQYAREHVGLSLSALQAKQFVARRAARHPVLREALLAGKLGFEAARQVARVATPETAEQWVARAMERTVKHLREEVDVAVRLRRCAGRSGCRPPAEAHIRKLADSEQALLTGEVELQSDWPLESEKPFGARRGSRWSECTSSVPCSTQMSGGVTTARCSASDSTQMSGGHPVEDGPVCEGPPLGNEQKVFRTVVHDDGRVEGLSSLPWLLGLVDVYGNPTAAHVQAGVGGGKQLEEVLAALAKELCVGRRRRKGARPGDVMIALRVRPDTYWWWKRLEEKSRRWLPRTVSFVRFISLCVWSSYRHEVPTKVAYASVHARDGYRCTSPVCCKRTVQPHHLKKRSQGGGDEDENVAALCCDCHLDGVHAGRLTVEPPASRMLWSIGRDGGLVVLGREVIRAALS
jgi:hypothetical protein